MFGPNYNRMTRQQLQTLAADGQATALAWHNLLRQHQAAGNTQGARRCRRNLRRTCRTLRAIDKAAHRARTR